MRFVQFSDVHLDSSIGGALGLPADKRAVLRRDIAASLARACALASECRADVVLIPGDLFDYESVTPETASIAADMFASIAPARVFISPGNHDSLCPGSPYIDPSGFRWPDNVHIFIESNFRTVAIPELECSVTGIAHAHAGVTDRLLAERVPGDRAGVSILLFHGSRDGFIPVGKETVIPFSDSELLAQGFTYAAVGHYHSPAHIRDGSGNVKGAYSGCVQGRDIGEAGEKVALVGEIAPDGRVELESRDVAERRVVSVEVDVTGIRDIAGLLAKVEAVEAASGARPRDIVSVALYGAAASTLEINDTDRIERTERFFHTCVNTSRVVPDYDLRALARESAAPSLKSAFVRRMLEMIDNTADEREQAALQDAVYYGLYALDGRKLEPRDVD